MTEIDVWRCRSGLIEREVHRTPKLGTRECICPICVAGTLKITRDDIYYAATCEYGCGQASVLR